MLDSAEAPPCGLLHIANSTHANINTNTITTKSNSIDQLLVPNMLSGLQPLRRLDAVHLSERLLGLALPSLYVWLLGFVIVSDIYRCTDKQVSVCL